MLSLTQTTGYAVRALGCLADTGSRFEMARQVADCTGIPLPYLSKVLNALAKAGLVEAKRGYQGGFRLRRPAGSISLLEVADAVEGPGWRSTCLLSLESCHDEDPCPAHAFWSGLRLQIEAELDRLKVRDMAEFERRAPVNPLKRCCPPTVCCPPEAEGKPRTKATPRRPRKG